MTPQHLEALEQREKQKAAVHEAGHATVAAARGARVCAWIHRNESGSPDEKAWLGHVTNIPRFIVRGDKAVVVDVIGALDSTYAVAGMVAEELYDNPDEVHASIFENWTSEYITPSPSDLKLCSEDWRERSNAVQEAMNILREQKPLFDRIVAELLEHGILTDSHFADLAAQFLHQPKAAARS